MFTLDHVPLGLFTPSAIDIPSGFILSMLTPAEALGPSPAPNLVEKPSQPTAALGDKVCASAFAAGRTVLPPTFADALTPGPFKLADATLCSMPALFILASAENFAVSAPAFTLNLGIFELKSAE